MASTTGRHDYSEIRMRKTTFSVLACSVNIVSSESKLPMQAVITTSNEAVISTVRDLISVGFITVEDLLSLTVEQVRNCDAISLRHVLPNAVLNELITTHKSISKEI
ncbi:hypothetical protein [Serratia marcescens]|uniref:hypothetical protein n=1 Tax=Serratia marcescens TaxID=615 RepID=UPI0011C38295|nr:hypothetical protein [Serratia marcescens]EIM8479538.1 hypothetical protein [Serratia marcescens]EIU9508435.1 hypothetical protein [Serratia marcescens]MBH2619400.1 hypothetical protein [Serratia marcescens]MBI6196231.1 hypothetical protein [Serratia marcescens]MBN5270755.1 hypothetical protein [Serratia marcescens]